MIRASCPLPLVIPALLLALAGCGKPPAEANDLADLDRELTGTNTSAPVHDPALTAALGEQIMIDPALAQSSNANAIRPPPRPDTGATPPIDIARFPDPTDPATLRRAPAAGNCPECAAARDALTPAALAERQPAALSGGNCPAKVGYSATWANRLPAGLPLYPDARVAEAAGADRDGCTLRIVSFVSSAGVDRVIDWYYTRATAAGYSAEHKAEGPQHVLAGTRGDAAYAVYVSPRAHGGTTIDLVANMGS